MTFCSSSFRRPAPRPGTSHSQPATSSDTLQHSFSFASIGRTLTAKHKALGRGRHENLTLAAAQDHISPTSFADLSQPSRNLYAQILRHDASKYPTDKDYHRRTSALISHLDRHLRDTPGRPMSKHCHLHARLNGSVTASARSCFETYAKIHLSGLLQCISRAAMNRFSSKTSRSIKLIEDTLGLSQVPQEWSEAFRRTFPQRYQSVNTSCDACYLTAISNSPWTLAAFRSIALASSKAGLIDDNILNSHTIQWIDAWFSTYDYSVASSMIGETEAIAFDIEKAIVFTAAENFQRCAWHSHKARDRYKSNEQRSATEAKRCFSRLRCRDYTMPKAVIQDALQAYQSRAYPHCEFGVAQPVSSDKTPASSGVQAPSRWKGKSPRLDDSEEVSLGSVRQAEHRSMRLVTSRQHDPASEPRSAASQSTVTATQFELHGPWSMLYLAGKLPFPHNSKASLRAEIDSTVKDSSEQRRPILAN